MAQVAMSTRFTAILLAVLGAATAPKKTPFPGRRLLRGISSELHISPISRYYDEKGPRKVPILSLVVGFQHKAAEPADVDRCIRQCPAKLSFRSK